MEAKLESDKNRFEPSVFTVLGFFQSPPDWVHPSFCAIDSNAEAPITYPFE